MSDQGGFDRTTAAIVRLQEKVDRLEQDFQEMKGELKDIKQMLTEITVTMTQKESQTTGWVNASKFWIGFIASAVTLAGNWLFQIISNGMHK